MFMRIINNVITGPETRLGLKKGSLFYTHVE